MTLHNLVALWEHIVAKHLRHIILKGFDVAQYLGSSLCTHIGSPWLTSIICVSIWRRLYLNTIWLSLFLGFIWTILGAQLEISDKFLHLLNIKLLLAAFLDKVSGWVENLGRLCCILVRWYALSWIFLRGVLEACFYFAELFKNIAVVKYRVRKLFLEEICLQVVLNPILDGWNFQ